jgi:uncharacterized membrane protein
MKIIKILFMIMISVIAGMHIPAAEAGVSVSPDRHIVSLLPGEEAVVEYQVHNSGDKDIDITIDPVAWSGIKDPRTWLTLKNDSVHVKAGKSSPVIVEISAPKNAVGEMVAMLFLCYKDTSESQLNIRNGVPLYLIVKGTEDYGLDINNIEVAYTNTDNLNIIVKIKNTGNIHIVPDVKVSIKDSEGKLLKELSLTRPNIVLRDKNHSYRLGWRNPLLRDGIYTITAVLDYEGKIKKSKEVGFSVSGNDIEMTAPMEAGN